MLETPVLISTWHARGGGGPELERRADEAVAAAGRVDGHLGGTVLREPGSPDVHIVHRFATPAALEGWAGDPRQPRADQPARGGGRAPRHAGAPHRARGLVPDAGAPAAALEEWLASFLGAYPLVVLFQWLLAPHLEDLPLLLRSALFPLVLLSLMTWGAMPLVTRVLHGWLTR